MKIEMIDENRVRLTAEAGMAIHEIGTTSPTTIIGAIVKNDMVCLWEDCEFGELEPEE